MAEILPWQENRLALVCRITDEDSRKRRGAQRLEKLRDPACTGTVTRVELINLLERKGFKVAWVESWHTWVNFQSWLKPQTPRQITQQLYRQLITDRGHNTTGLCPFVERGRLFLKQSWLAIVAEKR